MKKQQVIWLFLIIIFTGLAFLAFGPKAGGVVQISKTTLDRVYQGGPTDHGYVSLGFASTAEKSQIVNVFVDLNGDGAYLPYVVDDGKTQEEHLVVDFPVSITTGEAAGYPVTLVDRALDGKTAIKGFAVFGEESAASSTPDTLPKGSQRVDLSIASVGKEDMSDFMDVGVNDGKRRGFGAPALAEVARSVAPTAYAAGTGSAAGRPNAYQGMSNGLPDTNQNYNECAPTAVSNNVRWLAKKYKFEDRIPSDTRELINELKADLEWNDGVLDPNFIPGKNAFFARRGIPIVTHQIGGKNDVDIHWKMYEEMQKGQAIEIGVSFFDTDADGTMHPAGGHTISVSAVYRQGGKNYIALNDSATRSQPNQPKSEYYEMSGDMISNYGGTAFIDYAWAQSPTDALAAGTYVDPTRDEQNFVAGPGVTLTPAGGEVTRGMGKFGFYVIDIEHPGDHMVGESFPVRATVLKRNVEQTMGYWKENVRSEYKHKAIDPWTLGGTFTARGKAAAPTNKFDVPRKGPITGDRYHAEATFTCTSPGPATIAYKAELTWTRGGGEPPQELLPRYAAQLEPSEVLITESPTFLCKSDTPLPREESRTAPPTALCPGVDEDPNGNEIDVLKQGAECFPTLQFHQAGKDKCDATHWHANVGSARSLKGATWVDPSGCGFGRVSEVAAGKIKLSADQVAPYIDALPGAR